MWRSWYYSIVQNVQSNPPSHWSVQWNSVTAARVYGRQDTQQLYFTGVRLPHRLREMYLPLTCLRFLLFVSFFFYSFFLIILV